MSSTLGDKESALVSSYSGTKAFDTVLAQSLANEFQNDEIDVLACVAGPIETQNFQRANGDDTKELDFMLMQPQDVANECLNALRSGNGDESIEILYTIIANSCHGGWNK